MGVSIAAPLHGRLRTEAGLAATGATENPRGLALAAAPAFPCTAGAWADPGVCLVPTLARPQWGPCEA